jgi:hypothetical protein
MTRLKPSHLGRIAEIGLLVAICLLVTSVQASTVCETVAPTIMLHRDSVPYVSLPIYDIP